MKSVRDVIKENRRFIGRKKELSAMEQLLTADKEEWSMLHFHGSAGMGKTELLQQFATLHEELPIFYIDGHHGFENEQQFIESVHHQLVKNQWITDESSHPHIIESLRRMASQYRIVVILLDGLDQCTPLLPWLKEEFLTQLPLNVRVYSAGRHPLDRWQTDLGWETIVKNHQLKPFGNQEWTEYAAMFGISNPRLLNQIGYISQGIPLALSITCNWIADDGQHELLSETDCRYLWELFNKYLLGKEHIDGIDNTLLALASMVYTFDQEILEHMLGKPINATEFSKLSQSAFVEAHANGGWMVKNGIRWWARATMKERFPSAYERYKQLALQVIEHRINSIPTKQSNNTTELAVEKYFLLENEFVNSIIYFGSQQSLHHRPATAEEIPKLVEMYVQNIELFPPYLPDDSHQEQYLEEIWNADPTSIQIIEHHGHILNFYTIVPLHERIREIFRKNPVLQPFIDATQLEENDWLFWMKSSYAPMDWEVLSYFLYQVFLPSLPNRRVTCMLWFQDEADFLTLLNFEHLRFADYRTEKGFQFRFYRLDRRATKHTSAHSSMAIHPSGFDQQDQQMWIQLTKKILNHYATLHRQPPILEQCNFLWGTHLDHEDLAERIRALIVNQLEWLKEGNQQEKAQAQILHYAYLKKSGSHEKVAELLDIPSSTYYRRLKKLIQGISFLLQSEAHPSSKARSASPSQYIAAAQNPHSQRDST